jgi:topoisomerase-4 subunit A
MLQLGVSAILSKLFKPADLEGYAGERGRRGKPLPRGFQRVERLIVAE